MTSLAHPVQLHVEPPARIPRIHVVIRLALLLALGTIAWSTIYWLLYLAVPALVALVVIQVGEERYSAEEVPRLVRWLRWLAGAYAYLWFLTDVLPTAEGGPVDLQVRVGASPTPSSAMLREIYSIPALLLLLVLSAAGGLLWLVAAAFILATERVPAAIAAFLTLTITFQFRLLAYHLSLVDRYPSLEQRDVVHAPA
jgi:hypothetical protein